MAGEIEKTKESVRLFKGLKNMIDVQAAISTLDQMNIQVMSVVMAPEGMTKSRTKAIIITMMVRKKMPLRRSLVRKGSWILQSIVIGTVLTVQEIRQPITLHLEN